MNGCQNTAKTLPMGKSDKCQRLEIVPGGGLEGKMGRKRKPERLPGIVRSGFCRWTVMIGYTMGVFLVWDLPAGTLLHTLVVWCTSPLGTLSFSDAF